jgi:hypothetical protein
MPARRKSAPKRKRAAPRRAPAKASAKRRAAPKKRTYKKKAKKMSGLRVAHIARVKAAGGYAKKGKGGVYVKQNKKFGENTVEYGPARMPEGYRESSIPANFELGA